jgi:hypothetical protein
MCRNPFLPVKIACLNEFKHKLLIHLIDIKDPIPEE